MKPEIKTYPFELVLVRTYDEFDPVKGLKSYLDKVGIDYIFGVDSFHFTTEDDRELARWVM